MADPTLWTAAVYQTVQTIPRGKVTTYGHVAALLGERTYVLFWCVFGRDHLHMG